MPFHTGQSFTFGETPSATKWNYLWENDYALADGSGIEDDAILARHIDDSQIAANHIDWSTAGEIWWEELGRVTLGVAGDTISLTPITARRYLKIIATILDTGTLAGAIRFNNDSGSNYATRGSTNHAASATSTSQSAINGFLAGADSGLLVAEVLNVAAVNKWLVGREGGGKANAATPQSARPPGATGQWGKCATRPQRRAPERNCPRSD